ncbi:MAG: CerR family C-terminal domain-containing protein [Chitinivorax sp.]
MPTPDPRAEETRKRLIEAGIELFGRDGFDAVTTRQLAEVAGVNQAAIPYHFAGKEGVYQAVAASIAASGAAQMAPVLAAARATLEGTPDEELLAATLLQVTLALARTALDPRHRGIWMVLHSREQFRQSAAFDSVYQQFVDPVYQLLEQLIGRLLREPASAADITRLAHAYLGQLIGFTFARPGLNRRLGVQGEDNHDDIDTTIASIERFSRMAIYGMRAAPI